MRTLVMFHPDCLEHRPGPGHPESPERLHAVMRTLWQPEFAHLEWREAPRGTREQVLLVHEADYVDTVAALAPREGLQVLDGGDTVMSPKSWDAVMCCVGAACAGVDAVMAGEADNVFCATRPCGHHAEPDRAMGFCIFNQVAIAAAHALHAHGLQRVAVIDFDVHHGNGTQAAFRHRPELFFGSSHQSPLYPGTGAASERGVGNIVNVPLPPGCGSKPFRSSVGTRLLPALRAFAPELILVSAGFDAHKLDPLAQMELDDDDFYWITREVMDIAADVCQGRIVSVLEGGYSGTGLAGGCAAHVRALNGR
ncbi:acetoin utilization deacetylase AcuC-like enzyme [Pseudoduganella flava]|uniref:Acetoin utilization deacetylase AcuC-like enzyme n=1 Tax=Pseudoduganella flava TaxID=871742 RepID=A0A562PLU6_9BURK|nr:histone deacetylase family protein [Pseudoduganella flava]QGZ40931.1 histone deacetylase family protein [Pseudoduganella flava]TWI45389.1 acetoin utilization deacetylase AcuC-like enzyme [Pseudoduganella flava]